MTMQAARLTEEERAHFMHAANDKNFAFGMFVSSVGALVFLLGSALARKTTYGALPTSTVLVYALLLSAAALAAMFTYQRWRTEYTKWKESDPEWQMEQQLSLIHI